MQACAIAFTVLKYIILLMLYVGALGVVYGIITFKPPAGTWPEGKKFPVAPAVQCTMILACQFFCVYGGIQVARSWTQFTGMLSEGGIMPNFTSKVENALMTATKSMNFAPMLAVLFIGARMRAPMKSTASMGAKFMLLVAVINAFSTLLVKLAAMPVN